VPELHNLLTTIPEGIPSGTVFYFITTGQKGFASGSTPHMKKPEIGVVVEEEKRGERNILQKKHRHQKAKASSVHPRDSWAVEEESHRNMSMKHHGEKKKERLTK